MGGQDRKSYFSGIYASIEIIGIFLFYVVKYKSENWNSPDIEDKICDKSK